MSDHVIMVKERAKVFLGGPPLVKMATGEESDDESLGGAEMHARTSGLADHFAVDEPDALRQARRVVARLNHRKAYADPPLAEPPKYDPEDLLGIVPGDLKAPFDPREVIARIVDASDFDEFKPLYGTSLTTGWASLHGYPVGILANARGCCSARSRRRPPSSSSSPTSATSPCCSSTTPPATWSARSTSRAASSSTAP